MTQGQIKLLPPTDQPLPRGKLRQLFNIIISSIQPSTNVRVSKHVKYLVGGDDNWMEDAWQRHWMILGITAYEKLVSSSARRFSVGDQVSMCAWCAPWIGRLGMMLTCLGFRSFHELTLRCGRQKFTRRLAFEVNPRHSEVCGSRSCEVKPSQSHSNLSVYAFPRGILSMSSFPTPSLFNFHHTALYTCHSVMRVVNAS